MEKVGNKLLQIILIAFFILFMFITISAIFTENSPVFQYNLVILIYHIFYLLSLE